MMMHPPKRRRLPSRQACLHCRTRKHRCDGVRPACGDCRSRQTFCQYLDAANSSTPHVVPSESPQKLQVAVHYDQQLATPSGQDSDPSTISTFPLQPRKDQDGSGLPVATAGSKEASSGLRGFFGESSTIAFVSGMSSSSVRGTGIYLSNGESNGESRIGAPVSEVSHTCNLYSRGQSALHLPERPVADSLVDAYFERFHPLYPFLHEGSFRAEYENMWSENTNINLRCSWYALLNAVFVHACEFCPLIPKEKLSATVRPFVDRSRETILTHVYQQTNMEFLQALLLISHYLQGTLDLNECWNIVGLMIRTAVSIGLHQDPDDLAFTVLEKEVRKRVWWGCFIIDQTLSMKLGRPRALQAADAQDVPCPSLIDDQYIHGQATAARQPSGCPSLIAFFRHTIELSKIIERILYHLYTGRKSRVITIVDFKDPPVSEQSLILSAIIRLDGELQAWWAEGPVHLRGSADDRKERIFERQQAVMKIRYVEATLTICFCY
jgi:hypothetical protein